MDVDFYEEYMKALQNKRKGIIEDIRRTKLNLSRYYDELEYLDLELCFYD
jgi:hypothetical protein